MYFTQYNKEDLCKKIEESSNPSEIIHHMSEMFMDKAEFFESTGSMDLARDYIKASQVMDRTQWELEQLYL